MNEDAVQKHLKSAFALIKSQRKDEALQILRPIVAAQRDNVQAWWLVANALENREQRCKALEMVLKLRPGHPQATELLEKLQTPSKSSAVVPPPPAVKSKPDDDPFADVDIDEDDDNPFDDVDDGSDPFGDDLLDDLDAIVSDDLLEAPRRVMKFEQTPIHIRKKKRSADDDAYAYMFRLAALLLVVVVVGGGAFLAVDRFMQKTEEELTNALMGDFMDSFDYDWDLFDNSLGVLQPGQTTYGELIDLWGYDFWEFAGQAGETVTIHVQQVDDTYGPMFYLFDPDGMAIGYGETGYGYEDWTQVQVDFTLPATGSYLIAIGSTGREGRYALTIYK